MLEYLVIESFTNHWETRKFLVPPAKGDFIVIDDKPHLYEVTAIVHSTSLPADPPSAKKPLLYVKVVENLSADEYLRAWDQAKAK